MLAWLIVGTQTQDVRELHKHCSIWVLQFEVWQSWADRCSGGGNTKYLQLCQVIRQSGLLDVYGEAKVMEKVGPKDSVFDVSHNKNPTKSATEYQNQRERTESHRWRWWSGWLPARSIRWVDASGVGQREETRSPLLWYPPKKLKPEERSCCTIPFKEN